MEIETVKIHGQGYLLNGIMNAPKADGNIEFLRANKGYE